MKRYWLMKSEPDCFSLMDLKNSPNQTAHWDGVRNYQARNFMKEMSIGDLVFFYHSNTKIPGIVGLMTVVKKAYPDFTALDPESEHPCAKSTIDNPRWFMVDVKYNQTFETIIPLEVLKKHEALKDLALVKKGNRLSIIPVSKKEWDFIMTLS